MNAIPGFEAQAILSTENSDPALEGGRFRWSVHIPLPFFWPQKEPLHEMPMIGAEQFELEIHNHFDQLHMLNEWTGGLHPVLAGLVGKTQTSAPPKGSNRPQKGEAVFTQQKEFSKQGDATADAYEKTKGCFEALSDLILRWQKNAPYEIGWIARPVSLWEVDQVYHNVLFWNEQNKRWETVSSSPILNISQHSLIPQAYSDLPKVGSPSLEDIANEVLAEACVALFRSNYRFVLISSYIAVENLAKTLYKQRKKGKTKAEPEEDEGELSFMLRCRLKETWGYSLKEEADDLYTRFRASEKIRHRVVHEGYKPTKQEAQKAYEAACEVIQWLCQLTGLPVKPTSPTAENVPGVLKKNP
ncbi:MAG TPA: hypothetical protein VFE46_12705 [Pirellulales bacterium]|jgi:hypothetical protein|nr:hypothetical protein [Pirellulales bacterium]